MELRALIRRPDVDPEIRTRLYEHFRLTPTQIRVALLLADRRTNLEIAAALSIAPNTARRHTEAVFVRLGVNRRLEVMGRLAEFFDSSRGLDAAD